MSSRSTGKQKKTVSSYTPTPHPAHTDSDGCETLEFEATLLLFEGQVCVPFPKESIEFLGTAQSSPALVRINRKLGLQTVVQTTSPYPNEASHFLTLTARELQSIPAIAGETVTIEVQRVR